MRLYVEVIEGAQNRTDAARRSRAEIRSEQLWI